MYTGSLREEGENFPPLKSAELDVLLALADGEMHGYGIRKEVETRSRGNVRLGPGTLYRTLDALSERGWVEEAGEAEEGGRRRRYYRITRSGKDAAAAEVARLEEIVAGARGRGISRWGFGTGPAAGGTR